MSPRRDDSNEYPQHMFLWRTDKNYPSVIIKYPPYLVICLILMVSRLKTTEEDRTIELAEQSQLT